MMETHELEEALSFEKFFEYEFCRTYGYVFEPFQRQIARTLQRERFTLTKVARGHGKTELAAAYAIWYAKYNPRSRITIVSSAVDQSTRLLARIKTRLADIGSLQYLVPSGPAIGISKFKNRKWNQTSIVLTNESEIKCSSFTDTIRGSRNDVIIADDILRSDGTMPVSDAIELFNSAFIGSLNEAGRSQVHIFGTPISPDDLLAYYSKTGEFVVNEYPAIIDGKPVMPSRFTLEDLERLKRIMGEIAFSREYMLRPIPAGAAVIPPELVESSITPSIPEEFDYIIFGVDIAMSEAVDADYTVVAVIGVKDGVAFLIDLIRRRGLSADEHKELLHHLYRMYSPDEIVIEKNGIGFSLVEDLEQEALLPITPYKTTRVNKEINIGRIRSFMEQNKLFLTPVAELETLREELSSMAIKKNGRLEAIGKHDDTVMALALALSSEFLVEGSGRALGLISDGKYIPPENVTDSGRIIGEVI